MRTIDAAKEIMKKIEIQEKLFRANSSWELKYETIFRIANESVLPLLNEIGIRFHYYDPDTSYQEDVEAYMNAILSIKEDIGNLLTEL